ncbi:hypothetical protein PUN28_011250 [Cardiocondyla obscurior]|uniref:Uncharacterized protein n=1 Tax=Cardiocondyla obscurior TaxID=286306 RepID=A0AAW2FNN1_9HYME
MLDESRRGQTAFAITCSRSVRRSISRFPRHRRRHQHQHQHRHHHHYHH